MNHMQVQRLYIQYLMVIPIIHPPFVPMHPSHSYFWSLKKESPVLHWGFSNGSILINIHEPLFLLLISKHACIWNPSNQTKLLLLYHLWNLQECHQLWNLCESFGLLMASNSSVQHVAWDMFPAPRMESFISIFLHEKCVKKPGTKLGEIFGLKSGSMFSNPKKGKHYAAKKHYLLNTMHACYQLHAYFLCHNYVHVFYH